MKNKTQYTVKEATNNGFESGVSLFRQKKEVLKYAAYLMREKGCAVTICPPENMKGVTP